MMIGAPSLPPISVREKMNIRNERKDFDHRSRYRSCTQRPELNGRFYLFPFHHATGERATRKITSFQEIFLTRVKTSTIVPIKITTQKQDFFCLVTRLKRY